ncbi:hypothetical protein MBRA1_003759 [Malassezia brasiliensis]|uniref:MPN domain-containing protein n=1 Tax=Malassezia brasiliensis TaxID=1821822 RepID=A0AAF0DVZ7_9BASI|nr:hypothetical protein MBRA1_003759 [Malassezia brasiliensis]
MPLAGQAPRHGTQAHKLTVPTNVVPFGGTEHATYVAGKAGAGTAAAPGGARRLPASPDELEARVATLRDELRFTSAMPIRHWIRTADLLKRQADQHHVDGDLEAQYVCILTDLLPHEHAAYARLDDESRACMRRNADTICHLLALTRDALIDARREAGGARTDSPPPALPSPPPSASRAAPARPSLRTGDSPAKDAAEREGRSPALKRVSFAEGSARATSPSPMRRALRRAFARAEPAEAAAASDDADRDAPRADAPRRAAPWWVPRARPKPARPAPLERMSRLSLTSQAPADTPLVQTPPPKTTKRTSWNIADLLPTGTAGRAPVPARSPPQLAPLRLPTSPLLDSTPLSPRGSSVPTSPRSLSSPTSPRKASGTAALPPSLQIAPNRLTSPTEKSLRAPHDEGPSHRAYPYTHGLRDGKRATPMDDLYGAIAQHMSAHQQQQGFVAAADVAGRPTEAAGAPGGPQPPPPAPRGAARAAAVLSGATRAAAAPLGATPGAPAPAARAARWGARLRTHAAPLPRALLPGAEEHDVLDTSASARASKRGARGAAALRRLHLPASLVPSFLECAAANTAADRETCGLLLGCEVDGALHVTDLVLPPQTGTSDSCTATSEEEVTALQLTEDLLTLGWIHTHPSHSCFLSSLDLHTHAGYQALLPEAVAVVCAPQHRPSLGVFRLTEPQGLRYILQCNASAPFHAHVMPGKNKELPLYTDATNVHVRLDHARHAPPVRVRDLR